MCGRGVRRRIAHQCHAAENQAGRAEIINRCEKRLIDVLKTVEVLRRQQAFRIGAHLRNQIPAHERRRHAEFVFTAVIIQAHLFQLRSVCDAIPAEIVAPVAGVQFVVRTRNRVAEGLKLIGQEEGIIGKHRPAGFRREVGFIRRATPDVIPRIDRLHLRREMGADTGPESITSDQQIGALTPAVGELDVNAAAILLDPLEHMSEMITLSIDRL
jgi:hypothetical protein